MTVRHSLRRPALLRTGLALAATAGIFGMVGCGSPVNYIDQVFGPTAGQARKIAQCESGMNPRAVSRTNDHGLFQINVVHRAQFARVTGQSWSEVYNPLWNSVYAKHLYDGQGWRPWSCRSAL